MDISLTDEQRQIQAAASEFFEGSETLAAARRQLDGERVVDEVWADLAEMEYPGMTVPEAYGGLGDGMLNLAVLLEAAGQYAVPAPLLETTAVAAPLIAACGTDAQCDRWLEPIAAGESTVTIGLYADESTEGPAPIGLEATETADGYRLDGTVSLVPFGADADRVLVPGRVGDPASDVSLFVIDTDAVSVRERAGFDRTRPPADIVFDDHEVDASRLLGDAAGVGDAFQRAVDRYRVGATAMLVGAAEGAVDRSVAYATEREQFGNPIGRFQAVKHRIVDMWMDMQAGRSLVYYAAWALETDHPDAEGAVSRSCGFVGETSSRIFGDDVLNHGATGFTWDHDAHIFLKQAKVLESYLGTPRYHRQRAADTWDD
jgi:alkylation response protein AidB-like acyl-CoA dehydrogenase